MQELNYQNKIVDVLRHATEPMDIEKIRVEVGIGNWNTALKHCLELLIAKRISGIKTSKSWVFWIDKNNGDPTP
jgi:hypothetical protein